MVVILASFLACRIEDGKSAFIIALFLALVHAMKNNTR